MGLVYFIEPGPVHIAEREMIQQVPESKYIELLLKEVGALWANAFEVLDGGFEKIYGHAAANLRKDVRRMSLLKNKSQTNCRARFGKDAKLSSKRCQKSLGTGFEYKSKKRAKMKISNDIKAKLLAGAANSVFTSGMSMFAIQHTKNTENYIIEVKAPGVSAEAMHVEIRNNQLFIYYVLDTLKEQSSPYMIRQFAIPYDVNINGIWATHGEGLLKVYLPYNEFAKGFRKDIRIYS